MYPIALCISSVLVCISSVLVCISSVYVGYLVYIIVPLFLALWCGNLVSRSWEGLGGLEGMVGGAASPKPCCVYNDCFDRLR